MIDLMQKAIGYFNSKEYSKALSIYKELAEHYGGQNFQINIEICQARINQGTLNDFIDEESSVLYQLPEHIFLSKGEKYVLSIPVVSNGQYILKTECLANEVNNKGVVADISFYDSQGNLLVKPYSGMAQSKAFDSYFYITTSINNSVQEYIINAPEGAVKLTISLVNFLFLEGITFTYNTKILANNDCNNNWEINTNKAYFLKDFEKIVSEAEMIPDSNGSNFFSKINLNVAVIADEYMYNFYKDVFINTYYLSPSNYEDILTNDLDLIIYTTCWKGRFEDEWKGVKFREVPKVALNNILLFARENNIKTVFQTIEDPSNFEYFLPIAERFDYVFTTDTDCIQQYKDKLKHDRVFYGEYGVNPQFNNPIGSRRNIRNAAFFAGSYPLRYVDRCTDMETVFDSIVEATDNIYIADRNYFETSEDLKFPERYSNNILPPVNHHVLQKIHKLFRYNLNFNSIKNSPTMCAMRIYELQAQGNGIISNYAKSVFNNFPGIRILPYKQDMNFDFQREFALEEYKNNIMNVREVLNTKTSYQIVGNLVRNIGLVADDAPVKKVAVISHNKTDKIIESFKKQDYANLVLLEEIDLKDWNSLKENKNIDYFTWFNDFFDYESSYITDLVNAFKYTDCSYITKNSFFDLKGNWIKGKEHEYTDHLKGKDLTIFRSDRYNPQQFINAHFLERLYLENGYSIDPFELNYTNYLRTNQSPKNQEYRLSVIVPIYNNGKFLLTKCLPSLMRNKIWKDMEVILVDDGSTELSTRAIVRDLVDQYANVYSFFNPEGGSGSASRPRNQGIDIATAPLVTFLDPDNEIGSGTYDTLVDLYYTANNSQVDPVEFVSGYHVKVDNGLKTIGKHTDKPLSIIHNLKESYFNKGKFPVLATQSAVISREFLIKNNIYFVEKSAGQDTLFGWEILVKANSGAFTGNAFLIYYADRSDSVTNTVDIDYFNKKLILEKSQVRFLKDNNLLNIYLDKHFDQFMQNWYLPKLDLVEGTQKELAEQILKEICSLYGKSFAN